MGRGLLLKHLQGQTLERCEVSLVWQEEPETWKSEDLLCGIPSEGPWGVPLSL